MTSRRFRQIDVFGQGSNDGNPVAVVLDTDGLDDETMRRFSAWTNLSECTFVLPPTQAGADYRVRIFSLRNELPFAGHPTLGTARAWLDAGGVPHDPAVIVQECGAGLIPVRRDGDLLAFAAPERLRTGALPDALRGEIAAVLGIDEDDIVDTEWLDNGPGWAGVLVTDAAAALSLRPDASRHPGAHDIGVVALRDSGETALEVRAFFTDGSEPLREDPVTGSLNAAAAQWLIGSGRLPASYEAAQGTAMGRAGRVRIDADATDIWVGGRTDIVVSGTVELASSRAGDAA